MRKQKSSGSPSNATHTIKPWTSSPLHFASCWKMTMNKRRHLPWVMVSTGAWNHQTWWRLWMDGTNLQRFLSCYLAGKTTDGRRNALTCPWPFINNGNHWLPARLSFLAFLQYSSQFKIIILHVFRCSEDYAHGPIDARARVRRLSHWIENKLFWSRQSRLYVSPSASVAT